MAMKKITRRWLVNGLGVIFVILLGVMIAFSFGVRSFYYSSVQQIIISRSSVISTLLQTYAQDSSVNFSQELQNIVETFEYRETMELMAIDSSGKVMMTSSGFLPEEDLPMPDFEGAMSSPDGIDVYQGRIGGENIMAVSVAAGSASENLAATRYVVSLEQVDNQILLLTAIIGSVCLAIILFVIFSSSYFINSIVNPVSEIAETARRIAQGDFKARLEKKNDDEIGELSDVINYMAEELANSEKLKNDFISSVSHELRTPLTAIGGWAETVENNLDDPNTVETGLAIIRKETTRLSQMVEELLDFSRLESGRMKLRTDVFDLRGDVYDAMFTYHEMLRQEGMETLYSEPLTPVYVNGDRDRLRQVFLNIIDNAAKYGQSGGKIDLSLAEEEGQAVVRIRDYGQGIPAEELPLVKEKFFKGSSRQRGAGIGLAVCDEIVALHGGSLDIESTYGEGTTVIIRLPLSPTGGNNETATEL